MKRILTIAGSDSGGGAGIQADTKTITMLGGYASSAITALTAQNTQGVFGIHEIPPEFIKQQIELVLSDIGADAIKTGMLHSCEVINAVSESLRNYSQIPLIVDPVMVATSGDSLLKGESVNSLKTKLLARASLATPNIPEAEILSGIKISGTDDMQKAGEKILEIGAKAVLVKGGHGNGDIITDILVTHEGTQKFEHKRIETTNTHGTGCTLASAIAIHIAKGLPLSQAIQKSQEYLLKAIENAENIGEGNGPLKHNFNIE